MGKEAGVKGLKIASFLRVTVGEGLEVESKDFAAEVQQLANKA